MNKKKKPIEQRLPITDPIVLVETGIIIGNLLFTLFKGFVKVTTTPIRKEETTTVDADFEIIKPKELTNGKSDKC